MLLRRHCTGFFPVQCCLESFWKHCTRFLPVQCCPKSIKTGFLNRIFSCPMLSGSVWANIAQGNHLCIVAPWLTNNKRVVMFLQENNLRNVVLVCLSQHCTKQLPAQYWPTFHSLVNVVQICYATVLVQFWSRAHRYAFAGKAVVVSNMSGSLFFNRVQYHRTILALFVQYWLGSSFTARWTAMNRNRH